MVWFSVAPATSTTPSPFLRVPRSGICSRVLPAGLVILQEGTEESIQDLDVDDVLRVDAQGPNFFFQHQ